MDVRHYIARSRRVQGWLTDYSAKFVASLADTQRALGVRGSVAEIGVHHGKLFILLRLCTAPGEGALAVDVFEQQGLNRDGSGRGDETMFRKNLRRWAGRDDDVRIIRGSSLDVRPADIEGAVGQVRLFSVDGGHTHECALNDMRLAEAALGEGGVLILDDMFNPLWPGVLSGTTAYMRDPQSALRPFAVSPNKVYWSHPRWHRRYRTELMKRNAPYLVQSTRLWDGEVDVYDRPDSWKSVVKESAIGPFAVKLLRAVRKTPALQQS